MDFILSNTVPLDNVSIFIMAIARCFERPLLVLTNEWVIHIILSLYPRSYQ